MLILSGSSFRHVSNKLTVPLRDTSGQFDGPPARNEWHVWTSDDYPDDTSKGYTFLFIDGHDDFIPYPEDKKNGFPVRCMSELKLLMDGPE